MRNGRTLFCMLLPLVVACASESTGGGGSAGSPSSGGSGSGGAPEGGAPEGGAGGSGPSEACQDHCLFLQSLAANIDCGYDGSECLPACAEDSVAPCGTELLAYYACLEQQMAEDFSCVDGNFTLLGGACDDSATALTTCLGR